MSNTTAQATITTISLVAAKFLRGGDVMLSANGTKYYVRGAGSVCPMSGDWLIPVQDLSGDRYDFGVKGRFDMIRTIDTF